MDSIGDCCCAKAPSSRAQSRERDSQLSKQSYLKKLEKKEEKRASKIRAAAARDVEEAAAKQAAGNVEEANTTHETTPVKANRTDETTPVKSSKKSKMRAMSEDSNKENANAAKELSSLPAGESSKKSKMRAVSEDSNKGNANAAKELGADDMRGRPAGTDEPTETEAGLMKQLRPRARSALKRLLEQERGQSERRAKADVIGKAKEEEALAAEVEAAKARRQAKWEAKQEAAKLAAMKEEKANPVEEAEAAADEEAAQLQALVEEAEAAAAALTKRKPALGVAAASSHRPHSASHVAPTVTTMAEKDVDDIDLAEWEIV